ncbi:MAG: GNAT family N-acetyltransferase [Verrucomicrobiota bacterium]
MINPHTTAHNIRVEPATLEDLPDLVELLLALFEEEQDFSPDKMRQEEGLRLILEQPNRGRIFVVRTDNTIIGMANVLIVISTAVGGFVLLLEDIIIHPAHRGQGFGTLLMTHIIQFAKSKDFKRITLLTDRVSAKSQSFFQDHGFDFSHMIPMRLHLGE